MAQHDYTKLPANLPRPQDDGACRHLEGAMLPDLALPCTAGAPVNLRRLTTPWVVVFVYPFTGTPGHALPAGWDDIPGARGCTPENAAIGALLSRFHALQADVFALSAQDTAYQKEMIARLGVSHRVLSDAGLGWTHALDLPTFAVEGVELNCRLSLICRLGRIERVFYPVFPPNTHPQQVLKALEEMRAKPAYADGGGAIGGAAGTFS